jgi:GNAT superfamily N-acetyltransferase
VSVRLAAAGDFEAVTALLVELGRPEIGAEPAACRAVYERQLADPDACHLVAEAGGAVVGVCTLHFRPRLNHPSPEAWVPDLVVAERARGGGIGGALLAEAERRALARGCHALTLESGNWRTDAHRFYLAAGLHDVGKQFFKPLGRVT